VARRFGENGVGFGAREAFVSRNGGDPADILMLIEIELAQRLVGHDGHGREDLHAISAAALVLAHDAVVQPDGGFGR
jgi:hypothetical protein